MYAITIPEPGGPEALVWAEVPDPVPSEGEVLVEVAAAAVNRADVLQRQGFYNPPPGASPYPGLECSGRIAALGPGVSGWSVGDEVCALLSGGGYAEKVAVPIGQLLPVPDGVELVAAAALPEVVCTVWSNVFMVSHLRPGETLLVHGGASGIGTMAIQLGKAIGARVAVTAGGPDKLARCAELGADILIDYREQDFVDEVLKATDGVGADVILDIMGAKYLERNVRALAVNGRLAVIGLQGGAKGELNLGALLTKRAAVTATSLRGRPAAEKAAIVAAVREHVWPLIADGRVRPVVDRTLPLSDAAEGHRVLEASTHVGQGAADGLTAGVNAERGRREGAPSHCSIRRVGEPGIGARLQVGARAGARVRAVVVIVVVRDTGRQRAAHLLQLGAGRHLLGEQGRLDPVEETFEPADQLGLRDAEFGLRGDRLVGERQGEPLQFLDQFRRQTVFQFLHGRGVDVLQAYSARLVERSRADFLKELLDHAADTHDLCRLFDHLRHRDLAGLVVSTADGHTVLAYDQDVGAVRRLVVPRHLHAAHSLAHVPHITLCPREGVIHRPPGDDSLRMSVVSRETAPCSPPPLSRSPEPQCQESDPQPGQRQARSQRENVDAQVGSGGHGLRRLMVPGRRKHAADREGGSWRGLRGLRGRNLRWGPRGRPDLSRCHLAGIRRVEGVRQEVVRRLHPARPDPALARPAARKTPLLGGGRRGGGTGRGGRGLRTGRGPRRAGGNRRRGQAG